MTKISSKLASLCIKVIDILNLMPYNLVEKVKYYVKTKMSAIVLGKWYVRKILYSFPL